MLLVGRNSINSSYERRLVDYQPLSNSYQGIYKSSVVFESTHRRSCLYVRRFNVHLATKGMTWWCDIIEYAQAIQACIAGLLLQLLPCHIVGVSRRRNPCLGTVAFLKYCDTQADKGGPRE